MDILHKSFAFNVKSMEDRVIEGYAATYGNKDLGNDIIAAGAFAECLGNGRKVRMLAQHDSDCVVGVWDELREDASGLFVKGRLAPTGEGNDIYELTKMGAIDSMSIGYSVEDFAYEGDVRTIKKATLWEVSFVTFPMNEKAKITNVKAAPHETPRAFEKFLRDAGYSQKAAKTITAEGYKALKSYRDDEDEERKEQEAIKHLLTRNINLMK
jgi:HK97 family phage prohead protease